MRRIISYILISLFAFITGCFSPSDTDRGNYKHPFTVKPGVETGPVPGKADGYAVILEKGWSKPVKILANDDGREDSTYITRDGRHILFYYEPKSAAFQESRKVKKKADPKIYYSPRPFTNRFIHPISSIDFNGEAGPMISEAGDIYYTKTFIKLLPIPHEARPRKTVVNGGKKVLDMGTGLAEGDPHYCDATGELYAQIMYLKERNGDQDICVMYKGKTTVFGKPINIPGELDFQPFLTDDGQTMYFTSSRGRKKKHNFFPFQIYRSKRLVDLEWGEPELFISFPQDTSIIGGVGEFGMTRDGKQMVFLQLVITKEGNQWIGDTDMYYAFRKD